MEKDTTYDHNNALYNAYKSYDDQEMSFTSFTDEAGDYDYDSINNCNDHSGYYDEYYD